MREDALLEMVRILGMRLSTRSIKPRDRAIPTVLLDELLDSSTAAVKLLSDECRVDVMIDNKLTHPADSGLIQPSIHVLAKDRLDHLAAFGIDHSSEGDC